MDAARELYAKDPVPQLTILAGKLAERVKVLEEQTKFLITKHFRSDKLTRYSTSGVSLDKSDFDFAIQYGSVEDIASAVRNTSLGWAEIKTDYIPMIRKHRDSDKIIQRLKDVNLEHLLKGGKTYRRRLTQRKHTRRQ